MDQAHATEALTASPKESWWARLTAGPPQLPPQWCVCCAKPHQATDVFCEDSDSVLIEQAAGVSRMKLVKNLVRGSGIGVALAVAYLHWDWTAYLFFCAIGALLLLAFVRGWPAGRLALGAVFVLTVLIRLGWPGATALGVTAEQVAVLAIAIVTLAMPLLVFIVVRARAANRHDGAESPRESSWLAFLLCLTPIGGAMYLAARFYFGLTRGPLTSTSLSLTVGSVFTGVAFALICGSLHSLRSSMEPAADRWQLTNPMKELRLPRVQFRRAPGRNGWLAVIVSEASRFAVGVTNQFRQLLEGVHALVRRFVGTVVAVVDGVINGLWRLAVTTIRHTIRTFKWGWRFYVRTLGLAFLAVADYARVFQAVPMAVIIAPLLLHSASDDLAAYIRGGPAWLPFRIAASWLGATVALGAAALLLNWRRAGALARQFTRLLSKLGSDAYLIFMTIAWPLAVLGTFAGGPFGFGWVTIAGTVVLVLALLWSQRRENSSPASS